ncbi:serine acetyltransferase [Paenarthrobacter nicotinovorans]|nr:serine acetyltransferase [Paenarthrobacter nicotinovorans]
MNSSELGAPGGVKPSGSIGHLIVEDMAANPGNSRIRLTLIGYRLANWSLSLPGPFRLALSPVRFLYKLVVGWIFGIDLPAETVVGRRLRIMHGTGLVVHGGSSIGDDCVLRHGVTVGIRGRNAGPDGPPMIGNRVDIGSGAQILGPIVVADEAKIGAGAVVLTDVPLGATAVGNPARLLNRP